MTSDQTPESERNRVHAGDPLSCASRDASPDASRDAERPPPHAGMRHLALHVNDLDACVHFYTELLGMRVEWNPDPDNFYLTSGNDNLALHKATTKPATRGQSIDHLGFIVDKIDDVDRWHAFLAAAGVEITAAVKTHRDGARSFYCRDPEGISVQVLYHPPIAAQSSR